MTVQVIPSAGATQDKAAIEMACEAACEAAVALLARLRARGPRVHCITNTVAQAFTANVLLAVGAVPSMTVSADEIGGFVASADAVLVNLGTCDAERRAAIEVAVAAARNSQRPWVLDPVMVERSPPRLAFARDLIARGPALLRLNAGEFAVLTGADGSDATAAARAWATVVAITGAGDCISDGVHRLTVHNGHGLMAKVTAMGCAGSALAAAALAVEPDPFLASVGALILFGVAGEHAARDSRGPGTFAVAFLDALYGLSPENVRMAARVSA
jgi:hydroxyethylthiazole kinase